MIRVTCAVIIKNSKILATRRSPMMKLPLLWEFPGGKIEPGESATECIGREIKEELGITIHETVQLNSVFHRDDSSHIELIPFLVFSYNGEIALKEHSEMGWFSPVELKNLEWAPADQPIVNKLIDKGVPENPSSAASVKN
jgi:8-oxo-dGTP diphosphatase